MNHITPTQYHFKKTSLWTSVSSPKSSFPRHGLYSWDIFQVFSVYHGGTTQHQIAVASSSFVSEFMIVILLFKTDKCDPQFRVQKTNVHGAISVDRDNTVSLIIYLRHPQSRQCTPVDKVTRYDFEVIIGESTIDWENDIIRDTILSWSFRFRDGVFPFHSVKTVDLQE
jgi:hypothetical protein